jgi:hypothetical protein
VLRGVAIGGLVLALAGALVPFYVNVVPRAVTGASLASGLLAIVCVLGYVAMRPWAVHGLATRPHVLQPEPSTQGEAQP